MQLHLTREVVNSKVTLGALFIDGSYFCETLEDVVRPDGIKVQNDTAIPSGKYEVVIDYSPRFRRLMPRLKDVPMFSGIRIHTGNTTKDTEGCIIVGMKRGKEAVYESRIAYKKLYAVLEEALKKEQVFITIL